MPARTAIQKSQPYWRAKLKNKLLIFCVAGIAFASCKTIPLSKGLFDCNIEKYNKPKAANIELFNAAKAGDLAGVKHALEKGKADINAADRLGQSAFMWACWNGNADVIDYMLKYDAEHRDGTKRKSKRAFLNYGAENKEKYNALFCLLMSNSMQPHKTLECMSRLLENEAKFTKKNKLLLKQDDFNETILHKAVRSGSADYLEFLIGKLKNADGKPDSGKANAKDGRDKNLLFTELLEKKNKSSETPLILAVKLQNAEAAKILMDNGADILVKDTYGGSEKTLSVLAFYRERGNFRTYLAVMKEKLKRYEQERSEQAEKAAKSGSKNSDAGDNTKQHYKYTRTDAALKEELEKYHADTQYWDVYNKFTGASGKKVINPDELESEHYTEKAAYFFSLFGKENISAESIDEVKRMLKESPYLVQEDYFDSYTNTTKSALQMSIENGNTDLFAAIFQSLDMNTVKQVSPGYGDYLICAIINNKPQIIEKLLAYNQNPSGSITEKLMASRHTFAPEFSRNTGEPTPNPVVQFLRTADLRNNTELLKKVFVYYESQFTNPNYAGQVYKEALKHGEDFVLFLYRASSTNSSFDDTEEAAREYKFYRVDKIDGRPVQFILLEKNYMDALQLFMENSQFKSGWYAYTDTQGATQTVAEKLEQLFDEPRAQKLIDWMKMNILPKENSAENRIPAKP